MTKQSDAYESKIAIAGLLKDIQYMRDRIDEMNEKMDSKFVTQEEFKAKLDPISKLVYGLVGLILTAVVGAIISIVVNRGG